MVRQARLWGLLAPYRARVAWLVFFSVVSNGTNLVLPWLTGLGINRYNQEHQIPLDLADQFAAACLLIWAFAAMQTFVQVTTAEKVARDLRARLVEKISSQDFQFVQSCTPARLLTNLTSDVDAVKTFVSDVIAGLLSSILILAGATLLLLSLNWRLALAVLAVIPGIGMAFALVLSRVRPYFRETREVLDRLNKVINEGVLGAALIRVVNGVGDELERFRTINSRARTVGMTILRNFATMIPVVNLMAQLASVIILARGGFEVVRGDMSVGDLATFNGYLAIVILPIFIIGFMNGLIAQAQAAFTRLQDVLQAPEPTPGAGVQADLTGAVEVRQLCLNYGERAALKDVSFHLRPGTRTAILGPTAAGKTQLLYLLTGLLKPDSGEVLFDGRPLADYDRRNFHRQVAIVFQESILFQMSLRENVAFARPSLDQGGAAASPLDPPASLDQGGAAASPLDPPASLDQGGAAASPALAFETAELASFVKSLPEGENTVVSERGTSLSGGQKQRLTLARALALNPKILLLDDFTARVDGPTERKILANLRQNYPDLTLLAVTQRISTIQDYDHIVLLMQGEVLAQGTHQQLLESSPEYQQIYESQKSTQEYE